MTNDSVTSAEPHFNAEDLWEKKGAFNQNKNDLLFKPDNHKLLSLCDEDEYFHSIVPSEKEKEDEILLLDSEYNNEP